MAKRTGLDEAAARFSWERFVAAPTWYEARQGKKLDAATIDREEPAPIRGGRYLTQRISAVVGLVRDRFIVESIARHLAAEKDVLVV